MEESTVVVKVTAEYVDAVDPVAPSEYIFVFNLFNFFATSERNTHIINGEGQRAWINS